MSDTQLLASRYTVRTVLGEGAMGTVYRVVDALAGGREVALKTIKHTGEVTPEQRLRFKDEFLAMARLKHPNTIEVLDFGQLDATSLYITMALVEGVELADRMGGRPMAPAEVYPLLIQLLHALAFIHGRQYVHRDIKSQNIRVRPDGTLVVMDFGLMAPLGHPSKRTVTGSPGYLAPEVVVGGRIDAATDLYAVGCLAYEMLTGKLPFAGSVIEVVRAHVGTAVAPLRQHRPDLPERLERLVMRLLEKDPARRYRTAESVIDDLAALAGVTVTRESADQRRSYLAAGSLVGRAKELAVLTKALEAAKASQGGAVLVGAPAGTGKSRLGQELMLAAKLGEVRVLHASAEDGGATPFEAIAACLRPALAAYPALPDERPALGRVFAELAADADMTLAPVQVAQGVLGWLGRVAVAQPVLVALDDLHWADAQSLAVFNHLVRGSAMLPMMVLGTFRDDEAPPDHALWYTLDDGTATHLPLGPLTPDGQRELVLAMLPGARLDDDFARALYQATGGNAFFLTEVLRALLEDGALTRVDGIWRFPADPAALAPLGTIEDALVRRIAHLPAESARLLGVASVLGRHQDLGVLDALAEMGEDALLDALEKLAERQFLQRTEDGYVFPHDRVREVSYAQLNEDTRRALHLRAGELLEARHAGAPGRLAHELARHFERAQDAPRAYRYLVLAGDAARAAGSPAAAIDLWWRADAIWPLERALESGAADELRAARRELWWKIGATGFEVQPDAACAALERLIAALPATDPLLPQARSFLAVAHGFAGRASTALAVAAEAIAAAGETDPVHRAALLMARTPALLAAGAIDDLVETARNAAAALAPLDLAGHGAFVAATRVGSISYGMAMAHQGLTLPDGVLERAAMASDEAGTVNLGITLRHYPVMLAALRGDADTLQDYLDWGAAFCRKTGAPPHAWTLYFQPYRLWLKGDLEGALQQLDRALTMPHLLNSAPAVQYTRALRGRVLRELGRLDEAEAAFTALLDEAARHGLGRAAIQARLGLGEVTLARGDAGRARALFEEANALAMAGATRNPLLQAIAQRGRARATAAQGDLASARRELQVVLERLAQPDLANPFERAHTLLALGQLEHDAHQPQAAAAALQEAGDLFQALRNAHGLNQVIRAVEAPRGERPTQVSTGPLAAQWKVVRAGLL